jgi:serine/threonine protein kinase
MAPEQLSAFLELSGWDDVGPPADLYSLGLMMHEMVFGAVPLLPDLSRPTDDLIKELLSIRLCSSPVSGCADRFPVSRRMRKIIEKCLRPYPGDRYSTAHELIKDLESCMVVGSARLRKCRLRQKRHLVPSLSL